MAAAAAAAADDEKDDDGEAAPAAGSKVAEDEDEEAADDADAGGAEGDVPGLSKAALGARAAAAKESATVNSGESGDAALLQQSTKTSPEVPVAPATRLTAEQTKIQFLLKTLRFVREY